MTEPLKFGEHIFNPTIRTLSDLKNVIYDKEWLSKTQNTVTYYYFRGIHQNQADKRIMEQHNLRFDMTIIPPNKIGIEFAKTHGHYHPKITETNISYPELYQVIEGEACYLLQKKENGKITDVVVIYASEGDIVIIPPNYGHITINASDRTLKMVDWVCSEFSSEYEDIEKQKGGAYYKLTSGRFIRNKSYDDVPEIRFIQPPNFKDMFGINENMYELIKKPHILEFLKHPQNHLAMFKFIDIRRENGKRI